MILIKSLLDKLAMIKQSCTEIVSLISAPHHHGRDEGDIECTCRFATTLPNTTKMPISTN